MEVRVGKCLCGEPEQVIEENGKQILVRCPLYILLKGKNPQDGGAIDHWGCAISWLPILMIENTKEAIELTKSNNSLRNENVKGQQAVVSSINRFRDEMVRGQKAVLRMAANGEVKGIADARDDHS